MFSEPQTVTVNAVAKPLPRVSYGDRKGIFETADFRLSFGHTFGRRNRHTVRLDSNKISADPFTVGLSGKVSMSVQLLIDVPPTGYTAQEQVDVAKAIADYCTSANLLKVIGGES